MTQPPPAEFCTLTAQVRRMTDGDPPAGPRATLRVVRVLTHYTGTAPEPHGALWAIPEEPAAADAEGDIALIVPMGTELLLEFTRPTDPEVQQRPIRLIITVPFLYSYDLTEALMT